MRVYEERVTRNTGSQVHGVNDQEACRGRTRHSKAHDAQQADQDGSYSRFAVALTCRKATQNGDQESHFVDAILMTTPFVTFNADVLVRRTPHPRIDRSA